MADLGSFPQGISDAWPSPSRTGEQRLRTLIEKNVDGMLVVGRDGVIAFANPAASHLLGRPAAELIGQNFGIPVIPGETTEVDIPRPDGPARVAEMRVVETLWEDQPVYLASLRDMTERKRAEEAVREREAVLRSFYDSAPMMMGVVEIVGEDQLRPISTNAAAERFLQAPPSGAGRDRHTASPALSDARTRLGIPDELIHQWIVQNREAERTGTPQRFEFALATAAGPRWFSATVGFIHRTPQDRLRFSFILEDITPRQQLQEELQHRLSQLAEADRRKDEFLAMLAHELRNPLAAIKAAAALARQPGLDASWTQAVIERQLDQLTHLIDDLLDVSRITRGKIRLRPRRLELGPIVRRAVEAVQPLVRAKSHRFDVDLPDDEPLWLDADPNRLEQILVNLLTNAAKYTDPAGHLRVRVHRETASHQLVVSVSDSGVGIAPEMLEHVFEPFLQIDPTLDRSQGGLGIGLTLVKTLVELHGGTASAFSAGLGRGSTFTIRLPSAQPPQSAHPSDTAAADSSERPQAVPPNTRVLVVDDSLDTARCLAQLLELTGYRVLTAHDGRRALDAARDFQPHIMLVDIGLPGLDGYEVARRIRQDPRLGDIALIAVSGYSQEHDRIRSQNAGFHHHLVKPVDLEALLALMTRYAPATHRQPSPPLDAPEPPL